MTVSASPYDGRSVVVEGVTYITPHSFRWLPDKQHTIAVNGTPQVVGNGTQYRFDNWTNSNNQNQGARIQNTGALLNFQHVKGAAAQLGFKFTVVGHTMA